MPRRPLAAGPSTRTTLPSHFTITGTLDCTGVSSTHTISPTVAAKSQYRNAPGILMSRISAGWDSALWSARNTWAESGRCARDRLRISGGTPVVLSWGPIVAWDTEFSNGGNGCIAIKCSYKARIQVADSIGVSWFARSPTGKFLHG